MPSSMLRSIHANKVITRPVCAMAKSGRASRALVHESDDVYRAASQPNWKRVDAP
jgi:hypothetical protein